MNKLLPALQRLYDWFNRHGWVGWDPYDIFEHPLVERLSIRPRAIPLRLLRAAALQGITFFPSASRRLLKIKPRIYPKAMGLILSSYTNLYAITKDQRFMGKALECADWLIRNTSPGHQAAWGYPFNWRSAIRIPMGTPSSVVTSIVGDGFYRLYHLTGRQQYLDICRSICHFLTESLNTTYRSDKAHCFSYTPIDDYQVHNANLFTGEFLTRIGTLCNEPQWLSRGVKCGYFALQEQQPEGFLPYWGLEQTERYSNGKIHVDHYHSGFEIRLLYGLWKTTKDPAFRQAYRRYLKWYQSHLFDTNGRPRLTPHSPYPINIHACAEAILCLSTLITEHPELGTLLEKTLSWSIRNMEYRPGEYVHLRMPLPFSGSIPVRFPMIRWGQAWMFLALSEFECAQT